MASSTALGQYLRARRELVRPEDVSLPNVGRRRVPGLRREELAMLAGISSDYYLRLEQGRDHHPSAHVIDALARALRLDEDATAHLHSLAQPAAARPRTEESERAPDSVIQLIAWWSDTPAFVQGRHMDVLAANALASAVSPVFSPGVNIVEATFLDPEVRRLVGDDAWDTIAHNAVARLRALAGPHVDDPRLDELVGELSARSERFRRLWARHDIEVGGTPTYTFNHPLVGAVTVHVELGDSDLPPAPQSGGSGLAMSLGGAIHDAAHNLLRAFLEVVADDDRSPLQARRPDDVTVTDGRIHLLEDLSVGETYIDILARHQLDELTAVGEMNPTADGAAMAPAGAFAAQFAGVRIDPELGLLRIARIVSTVDAGRVLNEKTARSQIIGATVMGIGMAVLEQTAIDVPSGRIANATFADYLIPVNADVPDLDVVFVGQPDAFSPIGIKGIGEVGIVGVPAAIANAVYHATGRRIRSLPITIDQLL